MCIRCGGDVPVPVVMHLVGRVDHLARRSTYRDLKPYDAPAHLDELRGPPAGRIVLPINVYWGPKSEVDLDSESEE